MSEQSAGLRQLTSDETYDVLVVGAGFAGVYLLHKLRDQGFKVLLVEAGSGLGGVWHWNCYPGARVDSDVPYYEFSAPELWSSWSWKERFPGGQELCDYFKRVEKVWNLAKDVRLRTRVLGARFDEGWHRWHVATSAGDTVKCRFMVLCTGFASKPYIPEIPGIGAFKGTCLHSGLWPRAGIDLKGKRVAVVGTGASGVQIVQEAYKIASQVTVFQRTPILALPMQQERLTVEGQEADKAHYATYYARRRTTFAGLGFDFYPEKAYEVSAAERSARYEALWKKGGFNFWLGTFSDVLLDVKANRTAYDFWREKTYSRIRNPKVARLMAPAEPPHPFGVKRPSLEQDYFEAFNEQHVKAVHLREEPISEIAPRGLICGGKLHELDIIVLATGFDAVSGGLTAIDIRSPTNGSLREHWADGVRTHLGVTTAGFPNMFMVYGPQSPSGFINGPTNAELQGDWLCDLLQHLRRSGKTRIESTPQVEAEWNELMETLAGNTLFPLAASWYMGANIPGKKRQLLNYPGGVPDYMKRCEDALADMRGFLTR